MPILDCFSLGRRRRTLSSPFHHFTLTREQQWRGEGNLDDLRPLLGRPRTPAALACFAEHSFRKPMVLMVHDSDD